MPKSKARKKKRSRNYELEPQRKEEKKGPSPRWYGPTILVIMGIGVAIIIANYIRGDNASPYVLGFGLLLIGGGFMGTMFWR
jgi:hypothetical protein